MLSLELVSALPQLASNLEVPVLIASGPAHAVYFATYEAVKHVMGGNQAGVHHPLAAGELFRAGRANYMANTA